MFDKYEQSNEQGEPISFYEFRLGQYFYRYTSANRDITLGVDLYSAMAISEDSLTIGGEAVQDDLNITVQTDCQVVKLFRGTPPLDTVWLTIRRAHSTDAELEAVVHWVGTISSVKRADAASSTIVCNTLGVTFKRGGLRLCWERNCPHMLYDTGCRVNPNNYGVSTTITGLTGNAIAFPEVAAHPVGYFDGGYIEWQIDDQTLMRRGLVGANGVLISSQIDTPSNQAAPRLTNSTTQADEGIDYRTIMNSLYSGQVAEYHDTDGSNLFFLRRDKDAFVAPEDALAPANWQVVYSEEQVVLYQWPAGSEPNLGQYSGTTTASQTGDKHGSLTLLGTSDGLTIGAYIRVYPGCDRTTGPNGCQKFNNISNYGGIPQLTGRSPFDGNPVF